MRRWVYLEIMVEFIMFAEEFPVDEVNVYIGIGDCKIDKKGDVILMGQYKQLSRIETHTSILYSTGYIETTSTTEPIKKIYDTLAPRKMQILESINQYGLTSKFCIVINLSDNPEISLSQKFIELAAFLKSEIEFDTYLDYDDEEKPILV